MSHDFGQTFMVDPGGATYVGDRIWIAPDRFSTDDGISWSRFDVPVTTAFISFPRGDTNGHVIARAALSTYDSILISNDYGKTWYAELFPSNDPIASLSVVDSVRAFALVTQDSGYVLYSRNPATPSKLVATNTGVAVDVSYLPVADKLVVNSLGLETSSDMTVFDEAGRRVFGCRISPQSKLEMSTSGWGSGFYFARVSNTVASEYHSFSIVR
jgi:hypothetical protein